MFENLLLQDILKNPALLALFFAIMRNIGGYVYNCFTAKKLVPYSATMLLETLALYETFFIAFGSLTSLPAESYVVITVIVDVVRSLKKAIEGGVPVKPVSPIPVLPTPILPVPEIIWAYSEWAYTPSKFNDGTGLWMRKVFKNSVFVGQETCETDPTQPDAKIVSTVQQ
jgi:hypothetical protein